MNLFEPVHAVRASTLIAQMNPSEEINASARLILQETVFPQSCDRITGEITDQDKIGNDEAFQNVGMRYDSYPLPKVNGLLVFVELQSQHFKTSTIMRQATGIPPRSVILTEDGRETPGQVVGISIKPVREDQQDGENSVTLAYYIQGLGINANSDSVSLQLGTFEAEKFGAYNARLALALIAEKLEPAQIEQAVNSLGHNEIRQLIGGICNQIDQRRATLLEEAKQLEQNLYPDFSRGGLAKQINDEFRKRATRLVEIYRQAPPENPLAMANALARLASSWFQISPIANIESPNESGTLGNPNWINGEPIVRRIASEGYSGDPGNPQNAAPLIREIVDILTSHKWTDPKNASELTSLSQQIGEFFDGIGSLESAQYWYLRSLHFHLWGEFSISQANYRRTESGTPLYAQFARATSISSSLVRTFVQLDEMLATAQESERLALLNRFEKNVDFTVGLHLHVSPANEDMARLAYATILNRKGRLLDTATDSLHLLRNANNPEINKLLDERAKLAREISNFNTQLNGIQSNLGDVNLVNSKEVEETRERFSHIQAELENRSTRLRSQYASITLNTLQTKIPMNAVLIEYFKYRWQDKDYYGVYIFRNLKDLKGISLGEANQIETTAQEFYKKLSKITSGEESIKELGKTLYDQVMQPIAQHLEEGEQLLISPDGALSLIPFEALVDQQDSYLIEHYSFSYLPSARDLMRLPDPRGLKADRQLQPSVLVGNPDYFQEGNVTLALASLFPNPTITPLQSDRTIAQMPEDGSQYRGDSLEGRINLRDLRYTPLQYSKEEINAIQRIPQMRDSAVVLGENATEAVLKQVQAPRILHISTHGFYLSRAQMIQPIENPLERSGLALAGFNQFKSGDDNGMLTALELSELNLEGTQLVVLSACETGLGDIEEGEGIYGLRRALSLAGAESQVVSLWQVRDDSSTELMQNFYANLFQPQIGRHEALRQAQLTMLRSDSKSHPYHWSAFVPVGNWKPMESN